MDIIHIGSTLQYIENWKNLLTTLNERYRPKYFVFSDLLAGDIPTFVSHQIFYEKKIPHLFINFSEFLRVLEDNLHLDLIFKTKFVRPILNQEDIFPNSDLPQKYRIDRPCNLVFLRK